MSKKIWFGQVKKNPSGRTMIITKELDKKHVLVLFEDGYEIRVTKVTWNKGNIKHPDDPSCWGVGFIGTGDYSPSVNGVSTPQYLCWYGLIRRCYDKAWQERYPAYKGCRVCKDWFSFQIFSKWYDDHFYQIPDMKMQLDKDLLNPKGKKIYEPNSCCFIPQQWNKHIITFNANTGKYVGISYDKRTNKFSAQCSNNCVSVLLGSFDTAVEAAEAYKTYKENEIHKIANEYEKYLPENVYQAFMNYKV